MKKKRKRERTVLQAIGLSVAAAIGVGLVIGLVMLMTQYTTMRILYDLLANNQSGETPKSELFLKLNQSRAVNDVITTAVACLFGGIALGRAAPSRLSLTATLAASAGAMAIFLVLAVGFPWAVILINQHGKLAPEQLTPQFIVLQLAFIGAWLVVGMIGGCLGYIWRMKKLPQDAQPVAQKTNRIIAS